jgi:bifunctional glutamyl/prolyl-tRNA synthetase
MSPTPPCPPSCFIFFKEQVTAEVNVLLDLKAQYKTLTGKDFKPPNSGGKKEKKDKGKNPPAGNKQENKQEKKNEVKQSQDERAVKKITRLVS